MRMNGMILCGSLILLIGCANAKKNTAAATPAPTPAPSATAQAPAPSAAQAEAAPANAVVEAKKESLTCKRGSEVRSLEVESLQPKGCKLWYSRYGNRDSVASSEKATTHCENVRDRIQKNLETVNFSCTAGAISQDNSTPAAKPVVTAAPAETQKK